MTNLEQFETMLQSAEADFSVTSPGKWATTEITVNNWSNSEHDLGYAGFFSRWFFSVDGKLIGVGHWE